ncbi:hypothetical protein F5887DRAFT_883844 [Amanita rubescens]|nr:hypothetical protein F5887DRAFT_883844 [Amanita rubescens]
MNLCLRFSDIHWLDATSEATIELGLMQIAQAKNAPQEVMHSPGFVLQWISQMPKWLIIYDNADGDYSVVEKFLPPVGMGNILITSRNWELKRLALDSMNVLAMEEDEAATLFLKSAMLDGTSDYVRNVTKKVVSELGGIALALDQAGAYIHRSGCGIDGYLKLYQKNKHKLMSRKEFKGASGYGRSAYGTWDISFQQIGQMTLKENGEEAEAAQNAIRLLRIFAFLNHENVPEEIFKNAAENYMNNGEWDRMGFLDGIQILLSFSLISVVNHLYSMHLLVNSWSRSCMSEIEISDHYHRARALLSCSVVPDWNSDNHAFCKQLAPHIRSNLLHGQELKLQEKYYDHEYERFSIVFSRIGSWDEEEKVVNAAVNERKAILGSDHPDTLMTMSNLASTYQYQGRWDEAEELQVEVMNIRKVKLGLDNPNTLKIMSNLASTYRYQGRWDEAEKLQEEAMDKWKKTLGLDHPDTLTVMNNLALTYQCQGRMEEAEKLQVEVINTRKVKFGLDYPGTLATMNNLALTYQHQGRWDEAEKLQVEVMNTWKVKKGADHPGTPIMMNNLALTFQNQGRSDEAEKLQVEAMNTQKGKLGINHPDTLTTMTNLALTYQHQGRFDEAEKLQVEVMNGRKVKLGSEHPDTLQVMANLALTYKSQERLSEAKSLLSHSLQTMQQVMGSQHQTTCHYKQELDKLLQAELSRQSHLNM